MELRVVRAITRPLTVGDAVRAGLATEGGCAAAETAAGAGGTGTVAGGAISETMRGGESGASAAGAGDAVAEVVAVLETGTGLVLSWVSS